MRVLHREKHTSVYVLGYIYMDVVFQWVKSDATRLPYEEFGKAKTVMTLIQHTRTHIHIDNARMLTRSLSSSVCTHYVMKRALHLHMDPANLISHWGGTAYIRGRRTGQGRED